MRPAPTAVLPELDPVRRVPLGLHGLVVPPLALGAGEGDRNSDSGLGHVSSLRVKMGRPGHADAPPWGRGSVAGPAWRHPLGAKRPANLGLRYSQSVRSWRFGCVAACAIAACAAPSAGTAAADPSAPVCVGTGVLATEAPNASAPDAAGPALLGPDRAGTSVVNATEPAAHLSVAAVSLGVAGCVDAQGTPGGTTLRAGAWSILGGAVHGSSLRADLVPRPCRRLRVVASRRGRGPGRGGPSRDPRAGRTDRRRQLGDAERTARARAASGRRSVALVARRAPARADAVARRLRRGHVVPDRLGRSRSRPTRRRRDPDAAAAVDRRRRRRPRRAQRPRRNRLLRLQPRPLRRRALPHRPRPSRSRPSTPR